MTGEGEDQKEDDKEDAEGDQVAERVGERSCEQCHAVVKRGVLEDRDYANEDQHVVQ